METTTERVGIYRPPKLSHRAEYWALRSIIRGLGRMSWTKATDAGARLGALGYRPLGIRRRVVERQIAAAFPEMSHEQVARLSRASFEHLGRVAVEAALLPKIGKRGVLDLVERVDGWELMERALAMNRGVIVVAGHVGNWELGGAYLAARGVPIDVVVRRMGNPLFDAYLNGTRLRLGMTVVYENEAVRRTTRALRIGRAVAFLADQGILHLASTFVPFFGRPAKTPRGPAVFALRWNVPVLFGAALRQPSGRFRVLFEELPVEDTGDREQDVDRLVARYTALLEQCVREYPEQYFWQHRRWKRQPADTPAELRDPAAV